MLRRARSLFSAPCYAILPRYFLLQVDNAYYAITKRGGALVCIFTQTHTVAAGGDGMPQSTSHDTSAFPAVPS
eukprot:scaffold2899_cov85-Skeletonema_dohrnii-CCMP3373.AAC.3